MLSGTVNSGQEQQQQNTSKQNHPEPPNGKEQVDTEQKGEP